MTSLKKTVIRDLMARDAAIGATVNFLPLAEAQAADSAEGVYKLALRKLGVACDGIDPSAYKALFEARLTHADPYVPANARDLAQRFPVIGRIRQL